jgi:alkylation response protein AidB-like acyl-CoA dehydrogenase
MSAAALPVPPAPASTSLPDPLEAATRLAPRIEAEADRIEAARRLPADIAALLADEGLFALMLPRAHGGHEASPQTLITTLETLGKADGATAWCVMIATTTSINAAYLPEAHARAIWPDHRAITGGVFAPRGKAVREGDHYRVTGRWPWGSGSANCGWLTGGALVQEAGGPQARMMWFPRAEAELIDTWDAMGLRGTGSGDIAVTDILVPVDRSVSLMADTPRILTPLYRFPAFGLLSLGVASVMLGVARAAMESVVTLAGVKVPSGMRRTLAERGHTQAEIARIEAVLRAARCLLLDAASTAWDTALKDQPLSVADRAGLRIAATHAVRTCAAAVRDLHDLAGGSSVYRSHPLERRFRDAHTITQHVMTGQASLELAGRALMGAEGDYAQL